MSLQDLLTDEKFTRKDIIHIQDPMNLQVCIFTCFPLIFESAGHGVRVAGTPQLAQETPSCMDMLPHTSLTEPACAHAVHLAAAGGGS